MVLHVAEIKRAVRVARDAVGIVQLSLRGAPTIAGKTRRARAGKCRDLGSGGAGDQVCSGEQTAEQQRKEDRASFW